MCKDVFLPFKCSITRKRTSLGTPGFFKLLVMMYLWDTVARNPNSWHQHSKSHIEYKSAVWCYCTKIHVILKHEILFLFFLSWALVLRNSDNMSSWTVQSRIPVLLIDEVRCELLHHITVNGPKLQWPQLFLSTRTERAPQDAFSFTKSRHL